MDDHFLKTREETKSWLDEVGVKRHVIQDDLTVDVYGPVRLSDKKLTHIPVQFGLVSGSFWCSNNRLISLKGSPRECDRFGCDINQLTSLAGVPNNCRTIRCRENPDLHDISAVPDGCVLYCDRDIIAKNQAARQMSALDIFGGDDIAEIIPPKSGRIL